MNNTTHTTDARKELKPSLFTKCPMSSVFQKSEAETIASNIMVILKRTGDIFRPLSWEEYKEERLKDTGFSSGEASYFDNVMPYCTDAKSASLFSPVWKEIYDKAEPAPPVKDLSKMTTEELQWRVDNPEAAKWYDAFKDTNQDFIKMAQKSVEMLSFIDKLKATNDALVSALKGLVDKMESSMLTADIEYYRKEKNAAKELLNNL